MPQQTFQFGLRMKIHVKKQLLQITDTDGLFHISIIYDIAFGSNFEGNWLTVDPKKVIFESSFQEK